MIPTKARLLIAALLIVGGTACDMASRKADYGMLRHERPRAPGQPNAMLAAARARRVNLFGEILDGPSSMYHSRSAVSLQQHTFTGIGDDNDPDMDSTGKRVVFSSTRHNEHPNLYIKSVDGLAVTLLTGDPASDIQPTWSPDDRKVAFSSNRSGNWDIWVVGIEGGQPVQVTSGPAEDVHPSWSPDGTKLVYCSLPPQGGQWELWTADSIKGGSKQFIGHGLFPDWSPVGSTIAFQRARERGSRWFSIWTMEIVDGEPKYPTEVAANWQHSMILPAWSPDGTRLAYASTAGAEVDAPDTATVSGHFDIWVVNADGSGRIRLTDGYASSYAPVFAANGRVYFTSNRIGQENVWSQVPVSPGLWEPGPTAVTRKSPETNVNGRAVRPTAAMNILDIE